jgi:hypothetical protein
MIVGASITLVATMVAALIAPEDDYLHPSDGNLLIFNYKLN